MNIQFQNKIKTLLDDELNFYVSLILNSAEDISDENFHITLTDKKQDSDSSKLHFVLTDSFYDKLYKILKEIDLQEFNDIIKRDKEIVGFRNE